MKIPPLVAEVLEDQSNYMFLTLIEYKKVKHLTIIENIVGDEIKAYALDSLAAEGIDQDWFMSVATRWFYSASDRYPLSFELTKLGRHDVVQKLLKTFSTSSVSRLIGRVFSYRIDEPPKVRRRRVKAVQQVTEIKLKAIKN